MNVAVSRGDTAARLAAAELVDAARANKVGGGGRSSVTGVVREDNGRALTAGVVSIAGTDRETRVDANGHFRIAGVPAGTRMIEVRAIGLAPATLAVDLKSGANLDTVIIMERRAQPLAEVAVLGKKPPSPDRTGFEERMHTAVGHFITAAEIEKHPAVSVEALLARAARTASARQVGRPFLYPDARRQVVRRRQLLPHHLPRRRKDGHGPAWQVRLAKRHQRDRGLHGWRDHPGPVRPQLVQHVRLNHHLDAVVISTKKP